VVVYFRFVARAAFSILTMLLRSLLLIAPR
jgi:hypothetical protein